MSLLLSQKNQLFERIETRDLSPNLFELIENLGIQRNETSIRYKNSVFEFRIRDIDNGWVINYSPAQHKIFIEFVLSDWREIIIQFSLWMEFLLREVNVINKWDRLSEEVSQINITFSTEIEKFSALEYEDLKKRMKILKDSIHKLDLPEEQLKVLSNKIDHLTEVALSLSKFDWKNLFVGTIMGIIIQLGVNHENAKNLWDLIKNTFNTYFL